MLRARPEPAPTVQGFEPIEDRLVPERTAGGELREPDCGADTVLVANGSPDGEADRLLVTEREAHVLPLLERQRGRPDPLEAGEGRLEASAVVARHVGQHGRRDNRGDNEWAWRGLRSFEHEIREEEPDLVTAERAVAASGRGHTNRKTVRVGVVGEHQIRLEPRRERQGERERGGLLGVRRARRREASVRRCLLGHDGDAREPRASERAGGELASDAVKRRVDDGERAVGGVVRPFALHARQIPLRELFRYGFRPRGPRRRRLRADVELVDPSLDLRIDGRDDLDGVRAVQLVAVVLGGVVARGHDNGRRRAELARGERDEGRRTRLGEVADGDAGLREDADRRVGEGAARRPRVAPDDDERSLLAAAGRQQVIGDGTRGALDDALVHA